MVIQSYSWTILDHNTAIKRTDWSTFENKGTGIPVKIRDFFEIASFSAGDRQNIILRLNGEEYHAHFERTRSSAQQTRLMWNTDVKEAFKTLYPNATETENYPDLVFHKKSHTEFDIEFIDPMIEYGEADMESLDLETVIETTNEVEGKVIKYYTTRYERSPANRNAAIKIHGLRCMACGFSFEEAYGELGRGFIEVHHIVPLYSKNESTTINPKTDLICLCSNCHRMIHHKKGGIIDLEELRNILALSQKNIRENKKSKSNDKNTSEECNTTI